MNANHEVINFYNRNFHKVMTKITGEKDRCEILKVMKGCELYRRFAKIFDLEDYEIKPWFVSMCCRDCDVVVTKGAGFDGADDVAIYICGEVLHVDYDFDNDTF